MRRVCIPANEIGFRVQSNDSKPKTRSNVPGINKVDPFLLTKMQYVQKDSFDKTSSIIHV